MRRMAETETKLCSQTETLLIRIVNCCLIGTWKIKRTRERGMTLCLDPRRAEPTAQCFRSCFYSFIIIIIIWNSMLLTLLLLHAADAAVAVFCFYYQMFCALFLYFSIWKSFGSCTLLSWHVQWLHPETTTMRQRIHFEKRSYWHRT